MCRRDKQLLDAAFMHCKKACDLIALYDHVHHPAFGKLDRPSCPQFVKRNGGGNAS
jgi:hypothetical protein